MFQKNKIIGTFEKYNTAIFVVGLGGIGFNIGEILIRDGFPLNNLYAIDPDIIDSKTIYKYPPMEVIPIPKVYALAHLMKIYRKEEYKEMMPRIISHLYLGKYLPEDDRVANFLANYQEFSIVIDCMDNVAYSKNLYEQTQRRGGHYYKVSFDGNSLGVSQIPPTGTATGYNIGSSYALSELSALTALNYIAGLLTSPTKTLNIEIEPRLALQREANRTYEMYSLQNLLVGERIKRMGKEASKVYTGWDNDVGVGDKLSTKVEGVLKQLGYVSYIKFLNFRILTAEEEKAMDHANNEINNFVERFIQFEMDGYPCVVPATLSSAIALYGMEYKHIPKDFIVDLYERLLLKVENGNILSSQEIKTPLFRRSIKDKLFTATAMEQGEFEKIILYLNYWRLTDRKKYKKAMSILSPYTNSTDIVYDEALKRLKLPIVTTVNIDATQGKIKTSLFISNMEKVVDWETYEYSPTNAKFLNIEESIYYDGYHKISDSFGYPFRWLASYYAMDINWEKEKRLK